VLLKASAVQSISIPSILLAERILWIAIDATKLPARAALWIHSGIDLERHPLPPTLPGGDGEALWDYERRQEGDPAGGVNCKCRLGLERAGTRLERLETFRSRVEPFRHPAPRLNPPRSFCPSVTSLCLCGAVMENHSGGVQLKHFCCSPWGSHQNEAPSPEPRRSKPAKPVSEAPLLCGGRRTPVRGGFQGGMDRHPGARSRFAVLLSNRATNASAS
jgi:hypothetical protein